MQSLPFDQKAARILVVFLKDSWVRPNHITALTVILALISGVLFSIDDLVLSNWAAGIFVLSRFLDHFDGELARLQGTQSKFGYYFDYFAGGISYSILFLALGVRHWEGSLLGWETLLGGAGVASALISLITNLEIDTERNAAETGEAIGYPGFAGFELEDGIYLLAPITWLGYLVPFFILAGIGASIYCLWTVICLAKIKLKSDKS